MIEDLSTQMGEKFEAFLERTRHLEKKDAPNIMTFGRIVLIPLTLIFMVIPTTFTAWCALFFYTVAAVTDWFDGYLARKWGSVSEVGRFLDPIADKMLVIAVLFFLAALGRLPNIWIIPALIILLREIFISGLREYLGPKNITVHVSKLAKWKTTIQMLAMGFLIMGPYAPEGINALWIGWITLTLAAVLTVTTGWNYARVGFASMMEGSGDNKDVEIIDPEPVTQDDIAVSK